MKSRASQNKLWDQAASMWCSTMLVMVSRVRLKGLRTSKFFMVKYQHVGGDPHNEGFHPIFQTKESRIVHQYHVDWRTSDGSFQLHLSRDEMGAEGWSESMASELNQFGIGIKTIEPGGMKTDFFTRSFDTGRHPAYDALVNNVMGIITDPKQMATYSSPEQIAEVVYEAATDGKNQLRYIAGADAKAMYAMRLQLGDEAFRKAMAQQLFGEAPKAA